jgi:exopolyphosphatase/pppGpp-phosphohydrolase
MALGYDGHQGHSHYLILTAGLAGFGPRELALIAQIVRYHPTGRPDLDDLRRSPGPETANWYSAARCSCGWRSFSRPGAAGGREAFRRVFGHRLVVAA